MRLGCPQNPYKGRDLGRRRWKGNETLTAVLGLEVRDGEDVAEIYKRAQLLSCSVVLDQSWVG